MFDLERLARERVDRGSVGRSIVGHQPFDLDPVGGDVGDGSAEEADRRHGLLVGEHLDVGEPGRVIDADAHVLPADCARRMAGAACRCRLPVIRCPAPPLIRPSFFTSTCTSSPGRFFSYRFGGSAGSSRHSLPSPIRVKIPETVESGIPNVSAISDPVSRNRRREAITAIRDSAVRDGTDLGAEQRSNWRDPLRSVRSH